MSDLSGLSPTLNDSQVYQKSQNKLGWKGTLDAALCCPILLGLHDKMFAGPAARAVPCQPQLFPDGSKSPLQGMAGCSSHRWETLGKLSNKIISEHIYFFIYFPKLVFHTQSDHNFPHTLSLCLPCIFLPFLLQQLLVQQYNTVGPVVDFEDPFCFPCH